MHELGRLYLRLCFGVLPQLLVVCSMFLETSIDPISSFAVFTYAVGGVLNAEWQQCCLYRIKMWFRVHTVLGFHAPCDMCLCPIYCFLSRGCESVRSLSAELVLLGCIIVILFGLFGVTSVFVALFVEL